MSTRYQEFVSNSNCLADCKLCMFVQVKFILSFVYYVQSLGQTGVVLVTDPLGDVHVLVKDQMWWYNPECLSVTTAKSEDCSPGPQPGIHNKQHLLSLLV